MGNAHFSQIAMDNKKELVVKGTRTVLKETSDADAKVRVVLGPKFANLLLEPVMVVHEHEAWFYRNPEAMTRVQAALHQSKAGKGKSLGSCSQYADFELDEDE